MGKLTDHILEIIKIPGNMVKITGIGVVSLMSLYEGIYITTPEGDKMFISTDELITPRSTKVSGTISRYNKTTHRMGQITHVQWAVKWLY